MAATRLIALHINKGKTIAQNKRDTSHSTLYLYNFLKTYGVCFEVWDIISSC